MSSISPNVYIVTKTYNYLYILANKGISAHRLPSYAILFINYYSIFYWLLISHFL